MGRGLVPLLVVDLDDPDYCGAEVSLGWTFDIVLTLRTSPAPVYFFPYVPDLSRILFLSGHT